MGGSGIGGTGQGGRGGVVTGDSVTGGSVTGTVVGAIVVDALASTTVVAVDRPPSTVVATPTVVSLVAPSSPPPTTFQTNSPVPSSASTTATRGSHFWVGDEGAATTGAIGVACGVTGGCSGWPSAGCPPRPRSATTWAAPGWAFRYPAWVHQGWAPR